MLPTHQEQQVITIDNSAKQILLKGGGDAALLKSLYDRMSDIKIILNSSTQDELNIYCQKYQGFYRYMQLLEKLAIGISNGNIQVPP